MSPGATNHYRTHLLGWLSYAFASEVFVIVSLTLFLPICLEQFARDNGVLLPDRTESCYQDVPLNAEQGRCVVKIGPWWIDSASFSLYVYSASVALQALTVISMGGIADHPFRRKPLLLAFAFLGATSATFFLALSSTSSLWWVSAILAICANVGFGASIVAMNSYLPSLAKEAPEVVIMRDTLQRLKNDTLDDGEANVDDFTSDQAEAEHAALLLPTGSSTTDSGTAGSSPPSKLATLTTQYETLLSQTIARVSSFGIALGYFAGIILLLLTLIPVKMLHGSTWSLRLAIGLSGLWWGLGCIPVIIWLPHGKLEAHVEQDGEWLADEGLDKSWNIYAEIIGAWRKLGAMLRWTEIRKLRNTFQFLAAWFLLSDGFTTITSTAVLFAKTSLHMPPSSLVLVGAFTPVAGILGSLIWPFLQRQFGWTNLRVLVGLVLGASLVPAYCCLGFLPVLKQWGIGGLRTHGEMYGLAIYFGSVYGAFQSYSRAFYSELVPPGQEARWFALYSITDKSSSFLGPLVVGLIADLTGNIRYSFFFLLFLIWIAVPILAWVKVEKGREDARGYVEQ